jgi:hypothetical protein
MFNCHLSLKVRAARGFIFLIVRCPREARTLNDK